MFVGGMIGFILDNTVAGERNLFQSELFVACKTIKLCLGTDAERGLTKRLLAEEAAKTCRDPSYDIPYIMRYIGK